MEALPLAEGVSLTLLGENMQLLARRPARDVPLGGLLDLSAFEREARAYEAGQTRFLRPSPQDGVVRFYTAQRLPDSAQWLVVGRARADMLSAWYRYLLLHLLGGTALLIVALLLFGRHLRLLRVAAELQRDSEAARALRSSLQQEDAEREATEEKLRSVMKRTELIADIGARLLEAEGEQANEVLRDALRRFRIHFGADRAALSIFDEEKLRVIHVLEDDAPGITPNFDRLPHDFEQGLSMFREIALRQPHIYLRDVKDLRTLIGDEVDFFETIEVSSVLFTPLLVGDHMLGLLSIDRAEGTLELDQHELELCRLLADSFANALGLIREEFRLQVHDARFRLLSEEAPNLPIQRYDQEGRVLFWNRGSESLYGWKASDVIGRDAFELLQDDESRESMDAFIETLETLDDERHRPREPDQGEAVELVVRHATGEPVHVLTRNIAFSPRSGEIEFYAVDVDLTRLRQMENRLREQAMIDELTRVANRRVFLERLTREVALAQRHEWPLALLMVDADRFKRINDRWGHPAGDAVLRKLGSILLDVLRETDLVGRIGGEEFAVALPQAGPEAALAVASRIRAAVAASETEFEDTELRFTVSIGVSVASGEGADENLLLTRADAALYAAKRGGRDRVELWNPSMKMLGSGADLDDSLEQSMDDTLDDSMDDSPEDSMDDSLDDSMGDYPEDSMQDGTEQLRDRVADESSDD